MSAKAEQKERTHRDILASAGRLLRSRGISGTSVGEVMKGAGLTVGGFYAHFDSKEHLVREAFRATFRGMWAQAVAATEGAGDRAAQYLGRYLSRAHRDHPEQGCPLPAVAGELGKGDTEFVGTLDEELRAFAEALAPLHESSPEAPRGQRALAMIALMYGGLSLARAVQGTPLSDEILKACRAYGRAATRGFSLPSTER
ncbi:TetR/AcrR family transcriptional regulator [Corallococcus sp. H22C18031201]|uniref:TetR/AcrR family transcriptional regulator n=1 Tax=Citreicoccus inhibens TaxID=2849499 RepID=UPI000E72C7B1|nr:TetR/AcrR family transcriptional regulator [Citreicoccus inhibens]MBU8896948.1 TetR/AcrR family transcriptional regulator [Citreicoccus inhibens]RJS20840.1 TetR/AcrR family transcriptional regulator [Corallococcus sp. H22C18031201]